MNSLGLSPWVCLVITIYNNHISSKTKQKKLTFFLLVFSLNKLIEAGSGGSRACPGCIDPEAYLSALASS